jgi:regulation of enolase protein 1 (concanavalin A-like superfamily)
LTLSPSARADTTVLPLDQWANVDIGTTPAAGSGTYAASTGIYTIKGSGADIWGTADNFHYSYQPLSGDGVIIARVNSVVNTNGWAKVGVMIRETLTPGSKYALMMVTPSNGVGLQYRTATSGSSVNVMTTGVVAPRWLKLERRGNVLAGYQSADGVTWILSQRIILAMASDVYVGLVACSHVTTSTLTTAAIDQVLLDPTTAAMALPWPWAENSIGTSTDQGVALYDGSYVLSNLGADIWYAADKLKFVSRTLTGDGSLTIRVSSNSAALSWARYGLMMRESLADSAKNVMVSYATGNGLVFQSRETTGGATAFRASAVSKTPPIWLKLDRSGNLFTASYSTDGTTWTVQGTEIVAMNATIQVGVGYSNNSTTTWAFGAGDQLKLVTPEDTDGNGLPDAWEQTYFGQLGVSPSADPDADGLTNAQEWELGTNPTTATLSGQQTTLSLVGGANQTGATGAMLPQPLAVKVTDANTGAPLPGMLVTFRILSGQGLFSAGSLGQSFVSLVSDANGLVQTNFQLSAQAGITTAQAAIGNQSVGFTLTSLLGSPGSGFLLNSSDIGAIILPSQNQYQAGVYTLSAATGDTWNAADSFDYASQSLGGDGLVVAHVASLTATNGWAKAGLMIRESLNANSRNIFIAVTPGNGITFQWRDANGGACGFTNRTGLTAPKWLALRRSNGTIAGYYSDDGQTWTLLASRGFAATQSVYGGLAFSTQNTAAYGQAAFDSVSVSPLAPAPWTVTDVGSYNAGNLDVFTADTLHIRGGGIDIWSKSDNFRYLSQPMPADGRIVVRVASQANTDGWAKSGLMIRDSSAANARFALLAVTPGYGVTLQARAQTNASAYVVTTVAGPTAPTWLKFERFGSNLDAFYSTDGQTWIKVGTFNWGFGASLLGLEVSTLNATVSSDTLFDHVKADLFADSRGWSASYFSNQDLSGSPAFRHRDVAIDFNWAAGQAPASGVTTSNYSVRWEGSLLPATTDTYTFTALSNGGVRLWVDGQLVIDRWALQSTATEVTGQVALTAGSQPKVVVEYFNGTDAGRIQLRWSSSTQADAVFLSDFVRPADSDSDGIPDAWETAHGLNALDASDALLMPDGDTLTNLDKYHLGVAPGTKADRVIGGAVMETWWGINDIYLWYLTGNSRFPGSPNIRTLLTSLEAPQNRGDNFGARIRGYIVPPADGTYQFWLAADDSAEFWLSPTDSPFDRKRVAYISSAIGYRDFDAREIQRSAPVTLQAGHYYYFEVLHKEGGGSDHVSVAWTRPGAAREVIAGQYLATFAPRTDNQAGDGLPDSWKTAHGMSVTSGAGSNGAYGDSDGDGLSNLLEYQYHTDPSVIDTDGDGFSDEIEVMAGSDPADANSVPALSPWVLGTVGANVAGDAAAMVSEPGYVVRGGGSGVWDGVAIDDTLAMAYQSLSADFEISACVSDLGQGGQGGLVIRSSLDPQAPAAALHVDTRGNAWFQVRPTAQATTILVRKFIISDINSFSHGRWLKLKRQGKVVTAFYSGDGQSWIQVETAQLDLSDSCLVGMSAWSFGPWQFTHLSLRLDSDKDGVYDDQVSAYAQQISGTDPVPAGTTLRTVASYAGTVGVTSAGSWTNLRTAIVSTSPKSALDFDIQVPVDGVYRLELEAQKGINPTINVVFPVELSVDGQFLGRVELIMDSGQVSLGHVATPWLTAGAHRVHVYYDSTLSYRTIQINALRLQALDGPDADGNGRSDWVDDRLALIDTLVPPASESLVSPAFIEGTTRFPTLMQVTAAGASVASLVEPGYGWYADVPLSTSAAVPVTVAFENGAVTRSAQITWKPLNLLADTSAAIPTGTLRIRKGDSLLLTAFPAESQSGSATIAITSGDQTVVTLSLADPASPQAYRFDQPGTYTLTGTCGQETGSLQVQVVQADFNGDPTTGLGVITTWNNPKMATDAIIDVDQGLSLTPSLLSGGGLSFKLLTANIGDSYAVSRLSEGGPILSRAIVHSLRVASDDATADDVLATYADGSVLMGTPIILSQVTPDTRVVVDIIISGVTFDDGTLEKTFTASDFDALGRLYVKFLYSPGTSHSFCHRIYVYQGDTFVGEF